MVKLRNIFLLHKGNVIKNLFAVAFIIPLIFFLVPITTHADDDGELVALKASIHTSFIEALVTYPEENYLPTDWSYILQLKSDGDTAVDEALDADEALLVQTSVLTNISNVPIDLDSVKNAAHTYVNQTIASYTEADYSSGNWSNLLTCKNDADSVIDTAIDLSAVGLARSNFLFCTISVNPDIANAKTNAINAITDRYTARLNETFSDENYTRLTTYKNNGLNSIATSTNESSIEEIRLSTIVLINAVPTTIDDFATAKTNQHAVLANLFDTFNPGSYTDQNWNTIVALKATADYDIELAVDMSQLYTISTTAINAMNDVLTITEFNAIPLEFSLSTTSNQISITNQNKAVAITVPTNVLNPTVDVSSFIMAGSGVLPALSIHSLNIDGMSVAFTGSTTVTSSDTSWNGVMKAPIQTTVTLPVTNGQTKNLVSAIEIGLSGARLSFDKAVRLLLPNQANTNVGYVREGEPFTEITQVCVSDSQSAGNALPVDGECKISVGNDLVIWTKHFTSFATYTQVANETPSQRSGGRNSLSRTVDVKSTTPKPVEVSSGRVLGASSYKFTKHLNKGVFSDSVKELQEKLRFEGFFTYPISTGYFGELTMQAVKKFQLSKGLPVTGYVGPLTLMELNK